MHTKGLYIILLILCGVTTVWAGVVLSQFQARTEDGDIRVTWKASIETDVREYVLERKTQYDPIYKEIKRINPKGANQEYTFKDERVYKMMNQRGGQLAQSGPQGEAVHYRLRIISTDGTIVITDPISVDYTPTAIRRTWGSIKAMFQ